MEQAKSIYEVAEQWGDRCFKDGCYGRHWVDAKATAGLHSPCAIVMRCAVDHQIVKRYTTDGAPIRGTCS